jgi:hypothetical protein
MVVEIVRELDLEDGLATVEAFRARPQQALPDDCRDEILRRAWVLDDIPVDKVFPQSCDPGTIALTVIA